MEASTKHTGTKGMNVGQAGAYSSNNIKGATGSNSNKQLMINALRFKFNQGFSNAVRRPVSVSDFA
jgi:hypothetical protein